jgi:Zn-finger nucleic acid-binding protein
MAPVTSADLTGRAGGYRGVAIRCPGCADPMRQLALTEAEVDVCDGCGGLWVDWFDGEVRAIATETLRNDAPPPKTETPPARNEAIAAGACPRCTRQLVSEQYVVKAEIPSSRVEGRTSLVDGRSGADLLRCEECMGAFVSRSSAEVLSWLAADQPPASQSPTSARPLPWDRLIALVKSLLALK